MRTFELTPAELRVMLAIVEVGGVAETAAAFGGRRNDRQAPSAPRVLQDRIQPAGRYRQARRRIFQPAGRLTQPPKVVGQAWLKVNPEPAAFAEPACGC